MTESDGPVVVSVDVLCRAVPDAQVAADAFVFVNFVKERIDIAADILRS